MRAGCKQADENDLPAKSDILRKSPKALLLEYLFFFTI